MGLISGIKERLAQIFVQDLSKKASSGAFGTLVQRVYLGTRGYKTTIGLVFLVLNAAMIQYTPPWADQYMKVSGALFGILAAAGLVDKLGRNEPVFEPWLLDALAQITKWIATGSAAVAFLASHHVFDSLVPGEAHIDDLLVGIFAGLTSAAALLNRLANASAAPQQSVS